MRKYTCNGLLGTVDLVKFRPSVAISADYLIWTGKEDVRFNENINVNWAFY